MNDRQIVLVGFRILGFLLLLPWTGEYLKPGTARDAFGGFLYGSLARCRRRRRRRRRCRFVTRRRRRCRRCPGCYCWIRTTGWYSEVLYRLCRCERGNNHWKTIYSRSGEGYCTDIWERILLFWFESKVGIGSVCAHHLAHYTASQPTVRWLIFRIFWVMVFSWSALQKLIYRRRQMGTETTWDFCVCFACVQPVAAPAS